MRLSHNELEDIKRCYLPGMKVELQEMYGEPQMPSGLTGTVTMVDSIGQIHVNWDNKLLTTWLHNVVQRGCIQGGII